MLVLIVPIHGRMARLSRPGWLVLHQDGLPALRQLPIWVLTGLSVAQLLLITNNALPLRQTAVVSLETDTVKLTNMRQKINRLLFNAFTKLPHSSDSWKYFVFGHMFFC